MNRRLLQSAVFILSFEDGIGGTQVGAGSGALVDRARRLVVTNYHVVGNLQRVGVFFPAFDDGKELITHPAYYLKNHNDLLIPAKVVTRDAKVDLAVLELDRVPAHVVELPFARKPAATGATVYSIGASGINLNDLSGALWRLSTGTVRGRYKDTLTFRSGQRVDAMFLETQKPVNPGDSGGPTVNDRGELVAVVSSGDTRRDLVKHDIDISEVQAFLDSFATKNGWTWKAPVLAPVKTPVPVVAPAPSPPPPATLNVLLKWCKTGKPEDRILVLRQLGALGTAAQSAAPALIEFLDDPNEEIQRAAGVALERIGLPDENESGCLRKALAGTGKGGRLFALKHYGQKTPLSRDQIPLVVKLLNDRDADTRSEAIRVLVHSEPDAATAIMWFQPRLDDTEPAVREAALIALGKWGPELKSLTQALIRRTAASEKESVRIAAVQALGKIGNGSGIVPALAGFLKPETPRTLRDAAIGSLLQIELADPLVDLPVLTVLLKEDDAKVKAAALGKVAGFGPNAKELLPAVTEALDHSDSAVRQEALRAVAAFGADAVKLAPQIAELMTRPTGGDSSANTPIQLQAVETLARIGPVGLDLLAKGLGEKLPSEVQQRICENLGRQKGAEVSETVLTHLFIAADRDTAVRPTAGDALTRIGGDKVCSLLSDRTRWSFKTVRGRRTKESKYAPEIQLWAVETLGKLDSSQLTDSARTALKERLGLLAAKDPDDSIRTAATQALAKLNVADSARLRKKP